MPRRQKPKSSKLNYKILIGKERTDLKAKKKKKKKMKKEK